MFLHRPLAINSMRSTGFTLIEMTVVLLLITLMASVAVRETAELGFQTRYEQTKDRLEMIRQAILGNPRQIINGQQAVSGFVADMGRLPDNLRELLQMGFCVTSGAATPPLPAQIVPAARNPNACTGTNEWRWANNSCTDGVSSFSACTGGHLWLARQSDPTLNSGLNSGWNGPYLSVSGSPFDRDALTDGWGRLAQGYCNRINHTDQSSCETNGFIWASIDNNYGWYFDSWSFPNSQLIIQSYGKDHLFTGSDYDADYPASASQPTVKIQDWQVDISGGISVNFAKRFGANAHCGFIDADKANFTTKQKCENAGGNWSGSACTVVDETSCKSVGGKWQSCFFSPSACTNTGGTAKIDCQFTQKACDAAGGSSQYISQPTCETAGLYWNTVSSKCQAWDGNNTNATYRACLTNAKQTPCVNAGGSWNLTTNHCDFTSASCSLASGVWIQDCSFAQTACTTAGGTWQNTVKPDSCAFSQAACTAKQGVSNGSDCYMSHADSVGAKYDANSCKASSGNWTGRICMNVFYRNNGNINVATSLPTLIEEDGAYQTVQFNFTNPPPIPIGQNAIGIYEYTDNDGDGIYCEPGSDNIYPADRQNPIQVDFHANTTLPVINW